MNMDFVKMVATKIKTKRLDMVEKDIVLHQILTDLSESFSENFVFKGGTCLIKHHIGYFRFSEDIDFTWRDQSRFNKKSSKEIRKDLSNLIDNTGKIFEGMAKKRGFDFKCVKSDKRYIELGGSNKLCTFKVWYYSEVQKINTFIKVQVNFVEDICTKPETVWLHGIIKKNDKKMASLFAEYEEYSKFIPFTVYGVKEILSEKVRALLTRRGIKARDFLDIYFIQKHFGIKVADVEEYVIRKTTHTLTLYDKYQTNFRSKKKLIKQGKDL
jgi:predicted nucleotidyltransferase component of viral defense system